MEIPRNLEIKLEDLISYNDETLQNILKQYKDFKIHCEQLIEKEKDPDKLIDLQNKKDLYSTIIDFIEDKFR